MNAVSVTVFSSGGFTSTVWSRDDTTSIFGMGINDMSMSTAPDFRWLMMFCSIDRNLSLLSAWPTWETSSALAQALNLALCAYAE